MSNIHIHIRTKDGPQDNPVLIKDIEIVTRCISELKKLKYGNESANVFSNTKSTVLAKLESLQNELLREKYKNG